MTTVLWAFVSSLVLNVTLAASLTTATTVKIQCLDKHYHQLLRSISTGF